MMGQLDWTITMQDNCGGSIDLFDVEVSVLGLSILLWLLGEQPPDSK